MQCWTTVAAAVLI